MHNIALPVVDLVAWINRGDHLSLWKVTLDDLHLDYYGDAPPLHAYCPEVLFINMPGNVIAGYARLLVRNRMIFIHFVVSSNV